MTFSALSYLVWYKKYRRFVKDLVDAEDFETAATVLEDLIADHRATFANDNGINRSELGHLEHALKHIRNRRATDTDYIKSKIPTILSYEPEQFDPHNMDDDSQ